MNEKIEQNIDKILQALIDATEKSADFVGDQAPLLVQEIILYKGSAYIIGALFMFLVFLVMMIFLTALTGVSSDD